MIVIGGGATGAGTARDCAKRGLKVMLIERLDFTAEATGRNHGLLHSGARYAVTDHGVCYRIHPGKHDSSQNCRSLR